jgi:hypothetical protein
MNILSVTLLAFLAEASAAQPQVSLKVQVGQTGEGTLDQPALTWKDGDLHVKAVASMTATSEVESRSPGITVADRTVTLCYHEKIKTPPPGQMVPHWARPVLLEFTVKGLPQQDYKINVTTCS